MSQSEGLVSRWVAQVVSFVCGVIQHAEVDINQIEMKMLTCGEWQSICDGVGGDQDAVYQALIEASTGLTAEQLGALLVPDYNSLVARAEDMFGKDSWYWFDRLKLKLKKSATELPLLVPVTTAEGRVDRLELKYPTLKALKFMRAQPNEQRNKYILGVCSGLGADELELLSVPDWRALNDRVTDFLEQTGDFFSGQMS